MKKHICGVAVAAWMILASLPAHAETITVFAASSLMDTLKELAPAYENVSGDKILFNFEASSLLARQIEAGAPADVFFSADEANMDALEKKDLVLNGTRRSRLSNSLVVVVGSDSVLQITNTGDLTRPLIKHVALADPKGVPAGVYAKAYLEKLKVWAAIESKVIPTENVRAALAAVESGNVEVGIVYKTDARISKKVKVAYEIPASGGPRISYPIAVIKAAKNPEAARKLVDYLVSAQETPVFEKYGFIVLK